MSTINLKRLISKGEISSIIRECAALSDSPIALRDANLNLLLGRERDEYKKRYPVKRNAEIIGWVDGDDNASLLASLLSFAAVTEHEKRSLSRETLRNYRELIRLHDTTEQIAISLSPEEVARVAIDRTMQSIKATGASIMLSSEEQNVLRVVAGHGDDYPPGRIVHGQNDIAAIVMRTGKAEIVNDVYADPQEIKGYSEVHSLMCAPLTSKGTTIGVFTGAHMSPTPILPRTLRSCSLLHHRLQLP